MSGDALAEHLGVDAGGQGQERRAETGGESLLRLRDAPLGARDLGSVPGEEMVHRLFRRQFGNRRHHAKRVAR